MSGTGSGGRYARTTNGLVASLVVTVLVVVAFVALRALNRDDLAAGPQEVDYLEAVEAAQGAGLTVAYPASLPRGWVATSVQLVPGSRPEWGVGVLTDEGTFVGLHQEDESVEDLLETYVDADDVAAEDPIQVTGPVAGTWEGWSDGGGDRAYSAALGEETVLVYGSAEAADQRRFIELLTTAPR